MATIDHGGKTFEVDDDGFLAKGMEEWCDEWVDYVKSIEGIGDLTDEAARQSLQLQTREFLRVDDHSAFAAAVGQSGHGALERHPKRQRLDFRQVDILMVAYPSLSGPARIVVPDPVSRKD